MRTYIHGNFYRKNGLKKIIEKDILRYNGNKKAKFPIELKFIIRWRKSKYYKQNKKWCRFLFNYFILKNYREKYHFQIPIATNIGEGFYIGHFGRIVINPNAIIGQNCNIAVGVTIGQENRGKRKGTPQIGNNVWIGTNATIVGNIKIGDNVLIAPNTFVNYDVPDNSIVISGKTIVKESKNATQNYISNSI